MQEDRVNVMLAGRAGCNMDLCHCKLMNSAVLSQQSCTVMNESRASGAVLVTLPDCMHPPIAHVLQSTSL